MNADVLSKTSTPIRASSMMARVTARACAIRPVDRRTGAVHRIRGMPLVAFSRRPVEAAADLLQGRSPDLWEAVIEPIAAGGGK